MNPDTEKLYTEEEVQAMDEEARKALIRISRQEYNALQSVPYGKRNKALTQMRSDTKSKAKKKRKQAKASRKKNR